MPFLQGRDLPPIVPDEPNVVVENVLADELYMEMLAEFRGKEFVAHLLVDPPKSSRVLGKAMTLFEVAYPNVLVIFRPCKHDHGEESDQRGSKECCIFVRQQLL